MLGIMNKCYGSVCSVLWTNVMVLYARYYEQMLWFCMLDIMNKRFGSYAQYYEKMVGFGMLDIMNKCYGSVCSMLWTNVMHVLYARYNKQNIMVQYSRYYGQNVRVQCVPYIEINVMVWYAQYYEQNVRV